ncbi:MAG: Hsp20/alpha crystallin family protein [Methanocorpusculum sp.]|nr:Hsp20/alpha crystallin family protein [Methanocorpusculum sp.]
MDLIRHLISGGAADPSDGKTSGSPSVIGVKFVVAGGGGAPHVFGADFPGVPAKPDRRLLPLELFESDETYTLQTELPGSCTDYSVEYADGKLKLITGKEKEYSAEIPLESEIDPEKTVSTVRHGVLEIVCVKRG